METAMCSHHAAVDVSMHLSKKCCGGAKDSMVQLLPGTRPRTYPQSDLGIATVLHRRYFGCLKQIHCTKLTSAQIYIYTQMHAHINP